MACLQTRPTGLVGGNEKDGKIVVDTYGWPVWQKSGLGKRTPASTDLSQLWSRACADCYRSPKSSNSNLTELIEHSSITSLEKMPVLSSNGSEKKLTEDDGPLYFVCKGKLITLPNEDVEIEKPSTRRVADDTRKCCPNEKTRRHRRRKTLLPFHFIFAYHRGKRKKRKQLRSSPSFAYVKAFGDVRRDGKNWSPVLAYSAADGGQKDSDPPSRRIIREKWREQAHVQFQLRLLQERNRKDEEPIREPSTSVRLQIIAGLDDRETCRRERRDSYFEFIKYWNPKADLFWMKRRILNWLSKLACFRNSKVRIS